MIGRYLHDIEIAVESIQGNKLKALLTALGIIFGVAAVISMLAIGNGAQREILQQMELVGVNNIIVNPVSKSEDDNSSDGESSNNKLSRYSPGLTQRDVEAIRAILPTLKYISPMVNYDEAIQYERSRMNARLVGVGSDYFSIYSLPRERGAVFTAQQEAQGAPICVIGSDIRVQLFGRVNPIGQQLKVGSLWLEVVGVLAKSAAQGSTDPSLGVTTHNSAVFVPAHTLSLRYRNRGQVLPGAANSNSSGGRYEHELDQIIIQVDDAKNMMQSKEIVNRTLNRLHQGVKDYSVIVPEVLLKQQQRTKDIFNMVLGAIAGISLLVGGIGIMNIMFATVLERTKEIGTRLAIGAKKIDIVAQFLAESILISVTGGLVGIFAGIGLSTLIARFAEIETVVTLSSVAVAFGVSVAVGVIFGFSPAKRAANRHPIESLRYE